MKRFLFCILLFISTISFGQQLVTPSFRAPVPGTSHADPVIYYYPGKFGGYDTLVNLNYLRSHFAALNDSLVFSNWFTGLGTVVSPLYIKRDSIFHLTAGTNISITGTAPNYIINAAGGTTINALTNGWGINTFSFNGSSAGIQVKADTSSGKLATQYYASVVVGADGIVIGLVTTTVTTTATTTAGTYRLNNVLIVKSTSTNTTIPAQDATLNRYTLIVGDASGVFTAINGTLAADAVEPDIPANKALIASIYIPAVGGTTTTTGGGSGKGTVTKVTSSTTDILVANQTTTPILTLNKVNGVPITYYDPTSSIQTQLNGKQATLVSGTSIKTINSASLLGSGNILLQTPLTAGTDYLAPTGSAAGLTGLPLSTGVTGLLPVANGGTGTASPGIVAGTNVTVTGTWPNQTVNSTAGGGTPGGSTTQMQYNNSGAFGGASALTYNSGTGSTYFGNPPAYVAPSGNIYYFGDSITGGTGSTGGLSYPADLSAILGLTTVNFAVSASTLEKRSPINWGGGTNMIDLISSIPAYSAGTTQYIVFLWGVNDWQYVGANYTPTNFTTDYTTVMNAVVAAGWPMSRVIITSLPYTNPNMIGTAGAGGGTRTTANKNLFSAAAQGVANSFGCLYTELDNYVANRGAAVNMSDQLHPNNQGHYLIAKALAATIKTQVYANGQTAAFNGNTELLNVTLNTNNIIADAGSNLIGITASGQMGVLSSVPSGTRLISPKLIGSVTQNGQIAPSIANTTRDIILAPLAQIVGNFDSLGNNPTSIQLDDSNAGMTFKTTYNGAASNTFRFYNGSAGGTQALFIDNGQRLIVGTGTPDGLVGSVDGQSHRSDVVVGQAGALTGTAGSKGGRFEPVGNSNYLWIRENSAISSIAIATSGGTDYNQEQQVNIWPKGEMTLQKGGTYTYNPLARLSVNSSTQGVLFPALTATQIRSTGYVVSLSRTSGTGYSTAPTLTFSAPDIPGGTLATATCTVSGGGINTVTLTNAGTGYLTTPTVTITGGGGSGGNVVVTAISYTGNAGLTYYNSTSNKYNYYDGTTVRTTLDSARAATTYQLIGKIQYNHTVFTPTTGGTVTLTNNQYNIINPAGSLAALTVTLPSSPANNDCVYIKYTQSITTVTYSGGTVVDGITAPTAGGLVTLTYDSGTTSWY